MEVTCTQDTTAGASLVPLVNGTPARMVAASQGHVWSGIADAGEIVAAADIGDHIDTRGDVLLAVLRRQLQRAAATAKRERAWDTHDVIVALIPIAEEIAELDEHEDHHRDRTRRLAERQGVTLVASSVIHEHLLTGRAPL